MKILLLILFLIFGGGILILSILRSIGLLLFGKPQGQSQYNKGNNKQNTQSQEEQFQKKVFDKNEGEYVKYEEIKD